MAVKNESCFRVGMKLVSVFYGEEGFNLKPGGEAPWAADSITVVSAPGLMDNILWAKVIKGDRTIMVNLSLCNEVEILNTEETDGDKK